MTSAREPATIRPYRPGDEAGAYHVCLKTGDFGGDGEPYFRADPDALGRIYVGPYLCFEPELAWMLEDTEGIVGYALAALDTERFFRRYETEWRPELVKRFPEPRGDRSSWSRVEETHWLYYHPDYFAPEPRAQYPSHCHIDLVERAQSRGHGRRMMEILLAALRERGSAGVFLGLSAKNERANRFYAKLGFVELARDGAGNDAAIYMGVRFEELA